MALIFDSLTTARVLESKGFTAEQAEGIAVQMNQLLIQDIATKGDVAALQAATQSDIASFRTATQSEIAALAGTTQADFAAVRGEMVALRTELKGDIEVARSEIASMRIEMKALSSELTVKIYTVGLAVVALVVTAQKLLA